MASDPEDFPFLPDPDDIGSLAHLAQNDRPYDWDDRSWDAYELCLNSMEKGGREQEEMPGTFIPDPDEIQLRKRQLRWLYWMGLSNDAIDNIMIHDCPHIRKVRKMVLLFGKEGARRRLERFLKGIKNGKDE